MATPRKYKPGRRITNTHDFVAAIEAGEWVYLPHGGRPKHPGVMASMTLHTLQGFARKGARVAVRIKEEEI